MKENTQSFGSEWLLANGLGAYAAGAWEADCSRAHHYLLVAPARPPLQRVAFVRSVAESILCHSEWLTLAHQNLEIQVRHALRAGMAELSYILDDRQMCKTIWMAQDFHGTYIRYENKGSEIMRVRLAPHVDFRDVETQAPLCELYHVRPQSNGVLLYSDPNSKPLRIRWKPAAKCLRVNVWRQIKIHEDQEPGTNTAECYVPFALEFELRAGEFATILMSFDGPEEWNGEAAFQARVRQHEREASDQARSLPAPLQRLREASNGFLIRRPTALTRDGRTLLAGYPSLSDRGRDAMIAMPGLLICTGNYEAARQVFNLFLKHVNQGLIPNAFSRRPESPNYESLDATLWMFSALYEYWRASKDVEFVEKNYSLLLDILNYHLRSATPGIRYEAATGLLFQIDPATPMTWMNGRAGAWLATPRHNRPVEVQALWYNALRVMVEFSVALGKTEGENKCAGLAERVAATLCERYWRESAGYILDDWSPSWRNAEAEDESVRPNQVVALGLPFNAFDEDQTRAVVDLALARLVTPYGLRSLSADHPAYCGKCEGGHREFVSAMHNGAVHPWLIAPFVRSYIRVHGTGQPLLETFAPLFELKNHPCSGYIAQMYDGDPPHRARGVPAFAASCGAVLQSWFMIQESLHSKGK